MTEAVDLLIVGAGPFGLSVAAMADHLGIDHLVVGEPMGFWRFHMPDGMLLRSGCDWHLDPLGIHTIERYLATQGKTARDVEPLSRLVYLDYAQWFQQQKGIKPRKVFIESLDQMDGSDNRFRARLAGGDSIVARRVVLALGFQYFKHIPDDLADRFPDGYTAHTCDAVNFGDAGDQRFLIVGGRQSAFEWAALLCEHGAKAVHVSHRHDTPAFTPSDWSWTTPMLEKMVEYPAWFRRLSPAQKQEISQRMWSEGRLKLEPWLAPRIANERITVWPRSRITHSERAANGDLLVSLDSGARLAVDRVIFATGYKVDMARIPLLAQEGLVSRLRTSNGFPLLDEHFQSSIPGLFITSMPASQDFGPFFGFTVSVRTSARLIAAGLSA